MPRFTFKLEPVLKARAAAEQQKQRAVAELERERRDLEDSIRRRQELIASNKLKLRQSLMGSIDSDELRGTAASSMRIMGQAQRLVLELAGVHKRLESARSELIEATRQRRAIELLRDQQFEQWKRLHQKREDAFLDELAVTQAARMADEREPSP